MALPADTLAGHCPRCLVQTALDSNFLTMPEHTAHPPGSFGEYELLREVARGGMGVVFCAWQRSLNRQVAIKMMLAGEFASPEFVKRFRQEATAAASLQHPNIVAIHEVGEYEGQYYFSMDFVEGKNLSELVKSGPLSPRQAARYLKSIAEAIHYAHQKGILHRDLKPSNILIDPLDQPRVTDFGLAKQFNSESELTLTGQTLGSPAYIAPEQAFGRVSEVDARSDIYSLGAVLYHLITGRPPFQGQTLHQVLLQTQSVEPVPPRRLNPGVPDDLQTICLKCLEKNPAKRYETARELGEDLGRFLLREPIVARPIGPAGKTVRWCQRRPMVAALAGAVVLLMIALAVASSIAAWRTELARRAEAREREQIGQANLRLAQANRSLQESVTILELQRAEQSFHSGDANMGLAQLAVVLRRDPSNHIAAERILSALLHRNWVLPVGEILRHPSFVSSVAFSPDGQNLATACEDGYARVWQMHARVPLVKLRHSAHVRGVCFSPDGKRLATACQDHKVRIWDWRAAELLVEPMSHDAWVYSVAFSPDGQRVVSASQDLTARIWSASTGALERILRGHTEEVHQAVFSPDGRLIATASYDHSARLWNAETGEPVGVPLRHPSQTHAVMGVCFSPDGKRLATASRDGTAFICRVDTGAPVLEPLRHTEGLNSVQFSPTGRTIAITGFDNTVRLWDAQSGQPISQPFRHLEQVNQAAFSPDGSLLATAGDDLTVRFWDVRPGQMLEETLRHNSTVNSVEFSRDGKRLVTASYDGTARVWDVETGLPLTAPMPHGSNVQSASFSPDGQFVVTAGDLSAWIWDAKKGEHAKGPFTHASGLWAASFSPDGTRLLTASADGTARVWNINSLQPVALPLQHSNQVLKARFSPDGTRIVTASMDHTARIWDAIAGAPITEALQHSDEVVEAAFSPDGRRVVTASKDNTARVWDARTGKLLGQVLRHLRTVHSVAFSHDGLRLVTGSADHTARIWDALSGEPLTVPMEHDREVLDVSFSPNDQRVVTVSEDRTARLWDLETGLPLSEPLRHSRPICVAQFSPDGKTIATGAFAPDYPGLIWQVPSVDSAVPQWLPALAEAVAALPIRTRGTSSPVSEGDFDKLRSQIKALDGDDGLSQIAQWFFADRLSRTVSPFQKATVAEYIRRRVEENIRPGLEQVVRLDPTNSVALGRLAKAILQEDDSPEAKADAANLAHLALRFDPGQNEARTILGQIAAGKDANISE
jgi:eukaryotic-like serine/threonine-protein kinase